MHFRRLLSTIQSPASLAVVQQYISNRICCARFAVLIRYALVEIKLLHILGCHTAPKTVAVFTWTVSVAVKVWKMFFGRRQPFRSFEGPDNHPSSDGQNVIGLAGLHR